MSSLMNLPDRLAAKASTVAGVAFAAGGVVQVVHPQSSGTKVEGLAGHLTLAFFVVALLAAAPAIAALGRRARPGRIQTVARAVAAAMALLGLTCVSSLAMGHDGVWFNVIAPLTNAVWLFGSIALAVSLKRGGGVSKLVALGLPVAWVTTIPLATLGGGLVTGAYFLVLGVLLADTEAAPLRKLAAAAR